MQGFIRRNYDSILIANTDSIANVINLQKMAVKIIRPYGASWPRHTCDYHKRHMSAAPAGATRACCVALSSSMTMLSACAAASIASSCREKMPGLSFSVPLATSRNMRVNYGPHSSTQLQAGL